MIKKVKGGYVVKSEKGKTLSIIYPTKEMAQQRLREIEMFKNINKK